MRFADKIRELPAYLQQREMERALRRMGFSAKQSKVIISEGFRSVVKYKPEARDGGE